MGIISGSGSLRSGSLRGRFGDHFRVGDHFGVGIISGAVQIPEPPGIIILLMRSALKISLKQF